MATSENTKQGAPATLVARVVNDQGRVFNVVLVRIGDRYGLNGALVNTASDVMVEFYDAYENDGRLEKGRGQFITRYYLRTLVEAGVSSRVALRGLDLCGGVPQWKVTGANVRAAIVAVEEALRYEQQGSS
jgi:hypothetical protein